MNHDRSHALFSRAQQLLPGGEYSPPNVPSSVRDILNPAGPPPGPDPGPLPAEGTPQP